MSSILYMFKRLLKFELQRGPSLDLVIYKMGGNNGQYDPTFTNIPQPEPSHDRDGWEPDGRHALHRRQPGRG